MGGTTHILQRFGRIPIALAAAISDINRNKYMKRVVGKPKKVKGKEQEEKQGLFHDFPEALRNGIILVAMEDAPTARSQNNEAIEAQRRCKLEKEEVMREKGLTKATGEMVNSIFYHKMCNSDAYFK